MYQPQVKYEFVNRYCSPRDGWQVFVDIDASEEGRTGGVRKTEAARRRQRAMMLEGEQARAELTSLAVKVGGDRAKWFRDHHLPVVAGDRDIVAFNRKRKLCIVAEVEGASTGQPEQKLYKAIGQLVIAVGREPLAKEWKQHFVLVVYGEAIKVPLKNAHMLSHFHICGLSIEIDMSQDKVHFGELP